MALLVMFLTARFRRDEAVEPMLRIVTPLERIKALHCPRCGLQNHELYQSYQRWPFVGFLSLRSHFQLHWQCQRCQAQRAPDPQELTSLMQLTRVPLWHLPMRALLLKVVLPVAPLLAGLLLWLFSGPPRAEVLQAKLANLQKQQIILLDWTAIAPPLALERAAEFDGKKQYVALPVLQVDAQQIQLAAPDRVYQSAFRIVMGHRQAPNFQAPKPTVFRVITVPNNLSLTRQQLTQMMQSGAVIGIQDSPERP